MITGEIDRIVTEYEDLWRKAAIEDRAHSARFSLTSGERYARLMLKNERFEGANGVDTCALRIPLRNDSGYGLLIPGSLTNRILYAPEIDTWQCECSPKHAYWKLAEVMIHLNNQHEWTWDMFANKFRDELARGIERAQAVRG